MVVDYEQAAEKQDGEKTKRTSRVLELESFDTDSNRYLRVSLTFGRDTLKSNIPISSCTFSGLYGDSPTLSTTEMIKEGP